MPIQSSHRSVASLNFAGLVVLAMAAACGKKADAVAFAPAASALAASKLAPDQSTWHFAIDPTGRAHVDLPGLKERIKGDATAADGSLDVDGTDLSKSRGQVRIDLSTFTTSTFGTEDDKTQTKHARTWLEVQTGEDMNESLRWSVFAIRAIDALPEPHLSKVVATRDGSDDVRTVMMTLHGELLVHGHAVPKDAVVDVGFRYPTGAAPESMPTRIQIDSHDPMRVVLKEHAVEPRDPAGKLLEWTTKLVAKVADTADVTVHLAAIPAR